MKKSKLLIAMLLITTILAMPLTSLADIKFVSPYTYKVSLTANKGFLTSYYADFARNGTNTVYSDGAGTLTLAPTSTVTKDPDTGEITDIEYTQSGFSGWLKLNHNSSSANKNSWVSDRMSVQYSFMLEDITKDFSADILSGTSNIATKKNHTLYTIYGPYARVNDVNKSANSFGLKMYRVAGEWYENNYKIYFQGVKSGLGDQPKYNYMASFGVWYTVKVTADIENDKVHYCLYETDNPGMIRANWTYDVDDLGNISEVTELSPYSGEMQANGTSAKISIKDVYVTVEEYSIKNAKIEKDEATGTFTSSVDIANNTDSTKGKVLDAPSAMLLATYDSEGKFVNCTITDTASAPTLAKRTQNQSTSAMTYTTYTTNVTSPTAETAKLFVWKSFNNITPLIPATEYPAAN